MERLRRIRQKIKEGALREMLREGKWVLTYVRRYRAVVAVHILLGVLSTAMSLGTSVASKYLIDAVTGYKSTLIASAAAAMAGMLLLGILLRSVSARVLICRPAVRRSRALSNAHSAAIRFPRAFPPAVYRPSNPFAHSLARASA